MTPEEAFTEVCLVCKNFPKTSFGLKSSDPLALKAIEGLDTIKSWLISQKIVPNNFSIKYSKGAGSFPRIPWLTILPNGQKTSSGAYVSLCFDKNGGGAVCGFAESTSNPVGLKTVKRRGSAEWKIDVDGASPETRYNNGYVNPKEFYLNSFNPAELLQHIEISIKMAQEYFGNSLLSQNIVGELEAINVSMPLKRLSGGLLSKPFTILTGNSGTGKTRSAEDLAAIFRDAENPKEAKNVALVAVGADWTDNRSVVGFVNHLRTAKEAGAEKGFPVYQSTAILDLLLEASKPGREKIPHFLILDEMNLSHVERYFADFLSAMEVREGVIRLHDEGAGKAESANSESGNQNAEGAFRLPRFEGDEVGVPRSLPYPKNLFVIGTVNVDETTYMFSPKVLDRAHVIEFEVDPKQVGDFLDYPKPLAPVPRAAAGQAEAFLQLSLRARGLAEPLLPELPPAVKDAANGHLLDLLGILQQGRFEFAFRTAKEVVAYLKVSRELADDKSAWDGGGWMADLDDEILQKILPRLHGSRSRAGNLVGALVSYFANGDKDEALQFFPVEGQEEPVKTLTDAVIMAPASPEFPRCFKKMQTMARVLVEEQFVSFIC
jgi:5-methylcytosine-specific restriction protein B